MVNNFFSSRTAIPEGSGYFQSSTRKLHSNDLVWQSLRKQQQILPHCGINLKVVLHRNRMKPMEKFAFKPPQRFHCKISIGNSMICSNIWHKYHVQIMLLFVYTTTRKRFVIFTCRYFKLSWNTTALSQSNCRIFSCSSIKS